MEFDISTLASGCTYSTDTAATGLNNNQIIVGGSGSGKTMSITEPCLLHTYHRNLLVTVTKPRIIGKYRKLLESRGYQVDVLDFANPEESPLAFDPMTFLVTDQDITCLAKSIVCADPHRQENSKADPYWEQASISLLSALIAAVMVHKPGAGLGSVMEVFRKLKINNGELITTNLDKWFEQLPAHGRGLFAYMNWKTFAGLPARTASCVVSALGVTLTQLFTTEIVDMMGRDNKVDMEFFARRKSVLFVVSSPVNPGLNALVSLFYAMAIKNLFEFAELCPQGKLPIPVHILCDDFATGAPIPQFDQYISIIREKGLSVTVLCQSESQLESMYGKSAATTIVNNCDSYVYTGSMDLETARRVGQRLNLAVDEVLAMELGTFAVFRRGEKARVRRRYPILEDPLHIQLEKDQSREESRPWLPPLAV